MILTDVNRVILDVAEIDGIFAYISNYLSFHYGDASIAANKEKC